MESWFAQFEHHFNAAASLVILGWIFKNHRVVVRGKDRLNTLWYRYCAQTKQLYTPLENGSAAYIPRHSDGD